MVSEKYWNSSLERRPMGECSTLVVEQDLWKKAKLFERYLLRLQVSKRGGSHQALNIDNENCRQLSQCFPNQNGNSSRLRSPLVLG